MRIFSLFLAIPVLIVCGYLLFHEPAGRDVFDQFAAFNLEAALNAQNGWLMVTVLVIAVRTLVFFILGFPLKLVRRRWRRASFLLFLLLLKPVLAWGVYLLLFAYGREVGFTRILWNLQDLGMNADVSAVLAIGVFNAVAMLLLPDLLTGLLFGQHELTLMGRKRKGLPPHHYHSGIDQRSSSASDPSSTSA